MRVEISAACGDNECDAIVEATGDSALAQVLPALARLVGAGTDAPAWLGQRLLAPSDPIAGAGLRAGSIVRFGDRPPPQVGGGVLTLQVVGGPAAGLVRPLERHRVTIGRAADCELVLPDADVSRRHAAIDMCGTAITVRDLGSTNGVTIDGDPVPAGGARLAAGAVCRLGASVLTVAGPEETPATTRDTGAGTGVLHVLRPPRRPHVVSDDEIVLPARASGTRPHRSQWLAALVPAVGGAAIAWYMHSPQFLLFALLSPLLIVSTSLGDRMHWRRSRRREAAAYRRRRESVDRAIVERLAAETATRRAGAPDAVSVARQAALPGSRLWERRRGDADVLRIRLGLAEQPSAVQVRDGTASAPAGTLVAVPVCVDLRRGPLGIAGPPDVLAAVGRWLVGQMAVLHSPADLELALVIDASRAADWQWARWLPHLRGRVASHASDAATLLADIAALVESRGHARRSEAGWSGPWLLLVVDDAARWRDVPGLATVLGRGALAGVATVCLDADVAGLPAQCAAVGVVTGPTGTQLRLRSPDAPGEQSALLDQVSPQWAADLARALAPLVDAASDAGQLPDACALLDVCDEPDPAATVRRWSHADDGARAVLGIGADGPLEVDLATDGPHALIAGTTGSGKSELLRTLVAGLASNHPPDELTLLLVDYKGGAAFAECASLPHVAGLVTDLDPYLTERALRALTSELRRRERLFAETGASDLIAYRRCGGPALARLVIVVDEFAALADELPGFLRGLVAVAQRGRSLGVHLVLATQRPGGAVSAEIRANTTLRIALRVTDPAESIDVVDDPAAAALSATRPGRGYLRCGPELVCFQAAHASSTAASAEGLVSVEPLGPWRAAAGAGPGADTQLQRVVGALSAATAQSGREPARPLWHPPLPDILPRSSLAPPVDPLSVPLGLVDLPDEQRGPQFALDLAAAPALLVCGTSRSGRTGVLATLALAAAEQLAPTQLHLYVIDVAGTLAAALHRLPHCATTLGGHEGDLVLRLLHRLAAPAAAPGSGRGPARVLLIDGWDALCSALSDIDAARCTEALAALIRVGPGAALTIAVTGDRGALSPRFAGAFGERVVLRLADRGDYALAGIAPGAVPASLPPGRGVRASDGALVQFACTGAGLDGAPEAAAAEAVVARWADTALGGDAVVIRPLPRQIGLPELTRTPGRLCLGVAGDRAEQVTLDPFAGAARVLVAGPPRSGRSTLLRLLARQAHDCGIQTLVAAATRSPVAAEAARLGLPLLGPGDGDGPVPLHGTRTLLLVDDTEVFADTAAGERLSALVRAGDQSLAVVAAGRSDDLATTYRGIGAEVRRSHCGILLRPGPLDGELLGLRLPRSDPGSPPGRGVAVGDTGWGPQFAAGEPVPIQVATPDHQQAAVVALSGR